MGSDDRKLGRGTAWIGIASGLSGILDLITTGTNTGYAYVQMGDPNHPGSFLAPVRYLALQPQPGDNVGVNGLVVTNFAPPSYSGKSSDGPNGWPYYNLQVPGGGIILAIGPVRFRRG